MKIELVFHFDKNDKEFLGDYYSVDVVFDGARAEHYGDYYHDKGEVRAEAFIAGVEWALGKKFDVKTKKIADGRY